MEKELEKRRDALGNTCRQSRFYSGVIDRDSYQWEVLASKSLTMPYKNNGNLLVSRKYSGNTVEPEKGSKSGNFRTNLVEFRVEKGQFLFVGHSSVNDFNF